MKGKLVMFLSALLVVVGVAFSSTASFLFFYQVKAPKSLSR